jgi:hypothetical protein
MSLDQLQSAEAAWIRVRDYLDLCSDIPPEHDDDLLSEWRVLASDVIGLLSGVDVPAHKLERASLRPACGDVWRARDVNKSCVVIQVTDEHVTAGSCGDRGSKTFTRRDWYELTRRYLRMEPQLEFVPVTFSSDDV